jgi:hypothetical protein
MEWWSSAPTTASLSCRRLISAIRYRFSTAVLAIAPTKAGVARLPPRLSLPVSSRMFRRQSTKRPIHCICPLFFLTSLPLSTLRCVTPRPRLVVATPHKFRLELRICSCVRSPNEDGLCGELFIGLNVGRQWSHLQRHEPLGLQPKTSCPCNRNRSGTVWLQSSHTNALCFQPGHKLRLGARWL